MSLIHPGYHLGAGEGQASWLLDQRMTIKANRAQTGGAYTLWEYAAPSGFAPPRHVHRDEDEAVILLAGTLYVICGDDEWEASAGSFLFLPRGIPHAFVVTSAQPVRAWVLASPSGPAGFENFVAELSRPAEHDGLPAPATPDVELLVTVAARHGIEILGPPLDPTALPAIRPATTA